MYPDDKIVHKIYKSSEEKEKDKMKKEAYKKGFKDGRVYQLERDMENFDELNPNPCDEN